MLKAVSHEVYSMSVKRAAEKLDVSVPYVRNVIRDGDLKAKKVGRRVLVTSAALQEFLDNQPDWAPGEKQTPLGEI